MGLPKGMTNNPRGRPRGVGNKKNIQFRESIAQILNDNWKYVQKDLKTLDPKDRLSFIEKLLPFVVPKIQAVGVMADLKGLSGEQISNLTGQVLSKGVSVAMEPNDERKKIDYSKLSAGALNEILDAMDADYSDEK